MKIKRIVNPFALASPRLGGRGWWGTSLEIVGQKQIRLRQIINTSSRTDADKSQARRLKNCPKEGEGKGTRNTSTDQRGKGGGCGEGANGLLRPRRIESIKFKLVLGNHCRERDSKMG